MSWCVGFPLNNRDRWSLKKNSWPVFLTSLSPPPPPPPPSICNIHLPSFSHFIITTTSLFFNSLLSSCSWSSFNFSFSSSSSSRPFIPLSVPHVHLRSGYVLFSSLLHSTCIFIPCPLPSLSSLSLLSLVSFLEMS